MSRLLPPIAGLGAVLLLAAVLRLGVLEAAGPAHEDLVLPGGVPATFYLPELPAAGRVPPPRPRERRPPALVLVHGYASDRAGMSSLARRLAVNGYAVLAIDLSGHGESRRAFEPSPRSDRNAADVTAAVDWLRSSDWVDGARIAVVGHSMGASTVLGFAGSDSGIDAAVMISGGRVLLGPYRPPNALFLVASGDPPRIRERAFALAARLAEPDALAPGARSGSFERGDAVRALEIPGVDHATILWSEATAVETLGWLDASFGRERPHPPALEEPRLRVLAFGLLALPFALLGVGALLGRLAPARPRPGGGSLGLLALAAALLAALPPVAAAPLASMVGLDVADRLVAHLALAGAALLAGLALAGRELAPGPGRRRSLLVGVLAAAAVYAAVAPLGVVVHRLTPGPERAGAALAATLLLLPFFLAFEALLRRGSPGAALLRGVAGRLLVLAVLVLGVRLELLPRVLGLLIGPVAVFFAILEIVAATAYARSADRLSSAVFQAAVLGWVLAAVMPLG